jgi:type VI secretion system secreted protein VgrG
LLQNWHREFNPKIGRYVERDPIGLAGGINSYLYADATPLTRVDPTGKVAFALPLILSPIIDGLIYFGTAAGAAWAANELTKDEPQECAPGGKCRPCKTVSGKTVAVGTLGYRPLDVIPDNELQHGVYGSHHNIFVANQMPYPKCDCFWAKQKWVAKPNEIQPSWIPIEHFAN